jgi:hypothetical protein
MDKSSENDFGNAAFKWIRAPEDEARRPRRIRAVAAVTLVGASFGFGIALGLISTGLQTGDHQRQAVAERVTKQEEANSPTSKAGHVNLPSLALGEPHPEPGSAPTSQPPITLLNPSSGDRTPDDQQNAESLRVLVPESGSATPQTSHEVERPAPRPRDRSRFDTGERSALADRIARSRGHDVIVILRRTTPPYDRKLVRGYVSAP